MNNFSWHFYLYHSQPIAIGYKIRKRKVEQQGNLLDPNNNKNIPSRPVIKRRGKKVNDDGFEHRASEETI